MFQLRSMGAARVQFAAAIDLSIKGALPTQAGKYLSTCSTLILVLGYWLKGKRDGAMEAISSLHLFATPQKGSQRS